MLSRTARLSEFLISSCSPVPRRQHPSRACPQHKYRCRQHACSQRWKEEAGKSIVHNKLAWTNNPPYIRETDCGENREKSPYRWHESFHSMWTVASWHTFCTRLSRWEVCLFINAVSFLMLSSFIFFLLVNKAILSQLSYRRVLFCPTKDAFFFLFWKGDYRKSSLKASFYISIINLFISFCPFFSHSLLPGEACFQSYSCPFVSSWHNLYRCSTPIQPRDSLLNTISCLPWVSSDWSHKSRWPQRL